MEVEVSFFFVLQVLDKALFFPTSAVFLILIIGRASTKSAARKSHI